MTGPVWTPPPTRAQHHEAFWRAQDALMRGRARARAEQAAEEAERQSLQRAAAGADTSGVAP